MVSFWLVIWRVDKIPTSKVPITVQACMRMATKIKAQFVLGSFKTKMASYIYYCADYFFLWHGRAKTPWTEWISIIVFELFHSAASLQILQQKVVERGDKVTMNQPGVSRTIHSLFPRVGLLHCATEQLSGRKNKVSLGSI